MTTNNINSDLFKRFTPEHKLEMIENLTKQQLLGVSKATILRIIREAGIRRSQKSINKTLWLNSRPGNSWNSDIESIEMVGRGKLFVDIYLQYSNTDTTYVEYGTKFFRSGEYHGSMEYEDRWGGKQTTYFTYDEDDKAKVYKAILLQYVYNKYKDKLNRHEK